VFLFYFFVIGINVDFQIDRDTNTVPYVIVNYSVPYSDLIFQKEDSVYTAEYLVSLVLKKDGYQLGGRSEKNQILVSEYKRTLSDDIYHNGSLKMNVPEEKFEVVLRVADKNSSRIWSRSRELKVSELKPTDIGSIRWLSNPSREVITEKDTVRIGLNLFSSEKGGTHLKFYFRDKDKKIYFKRDTILPEKKNQSVEVSIPSDRFEEGVYDFVAEVKNTVGGKVVKKAISFRVWKPFFKSKRYFERVRQMAYITTSKEENKLLNAKVGERETIWNEFWESKDPTPEDRVNEFLIEYFERVDYANKNFSRGSFFEGWRTDRGKVYIILGPPDYVVEESFDINQNPYQIWYYYDKGYELFFVQRYLTGDYELQNPPSEVW
jgi:GWxTD domain-containing protein